MNLIRQDLEGAAVGVGIADTSDDLEVIAKPGFAAAVWRRQPMPGFQTWIDALPPQQLPVARLVLRPNAVLGTLRNLFDGSDLKYNAERFWLESDVADLAQNFARILGAPYLRVRFDRITTNACRRFHIDAIKCRLICTYRGSGTQYGISIDGEEPKRVFQVATGSPVLLRGTLWPQDPPSGLLHRSPPIEGTGETRWVVVMDPVYDLDDEA